MTLDRCHSKFLLIYQYAEFVVTLYTANPCQKKKKTLPFTLIIIASRSTTPIISNIGVGNDGGYIKLVR